MEQINYFEPSRHKVYQGYQSGGKINCTFVVGSAHRNKTEGFFILKLNPFPNVRYYLVKNHLDDDKYTLFTGIRKTEDGYKFFRPIGKAILLEGDIFEKQAYLKIFIPLLSMKLYLDVSNNTIGEEQEYSELDFGSGLKDIA